MKRRLCGIDLQSLQWDTVYTGHFDSLQLSKSFMAFLSTKSSFLKGVGSRYVIKLKYNPLNGLYFYPFHSHQKSKEGMCLGKNDLLLYLYSKRMWNGRGLNRKYVKTT